MKTKNIIILSTAFCSTLLVISCSESSSKTPDSPIKLSTVYNGAEINTLDPLVQEYLALEDDPSTPYDEIATWFGTHAVAGKALPESAKVYWEVTSKAVEPFTVTVSKTENFESTTKYNNIYSDVCYIYNLEPGKYFYKVEDSAGHQTATDSFKVINDWRIIQFKSDNMRDLGGRKCDGGTIKYGKLYRSAEIKNFDHQNEDIWINQLKMKYELDVRLPSGGTTRTSEHPMNGVNFYNIGFTDDYTRMVSASKTAAYELVNFLGYNSVYPCDFHCAQGLDRTGFVALLIEGMLGVSDEDIYRDYELSSLYRLNNIQLRADLVPYGDLADKKYIFREDGINSQLYQGPSGREVGAGFKKIVEKDLASYYGQKGTIAEAVTNYLKNDCNVTDQMIEKVKTKLVNFD